MPVRIGQFVDTDLFGGAEALMIEFALQLPPRGYEVEIFHFDNPRFVSECRRRNVTLVHAPASEDYKSIWTLPRFCREFARMLKERRISLLHSHLIGSVSAGGFAARLAGIPHVGTLHDLYTVADDPRRIRLLQVAALLGTRLIAVAHVIETFYRSLGWFPGNTLATIHNGISTDARAVDREQLRAQLGLPRQALVFVSVGRLIPLKRHSLILEAFARLPAAPDARLLIVGEGVERQALQTRAGELGIDQRVVFAGFREDVRAVLMASDVFMLTSSSEGLSCSLMEAMSAGIPSIVTDVGGNSELITDGSSGFVVDGTPESVASAMLRIGADPTLRATFGRTAREAFERNFTAGRMIERYEMLYRRMLQRAR